MSVPYPKLARWIQDQLDRTGWTVTELVRRSNVDRSGLQRWKAGALRPSVENARALADACNRPILELLVAADYLTPDEARQRTDVQVAPESLTHEQLAAEVLRRMKSSAGADQPRLTRAEIEANPDRYEVIDLDNARGRGREATGSTDTEGDSTQ